MVEFTWKDNPSHYEFRPGIQKKDEVVLFTHGIGLEMQTWDQVFAILGNEFSLLRYNFPGHGGRENRLFDSLRYVEADLIALLNHLHIKKSISLAIP